MNTGQKFIYKPIVICCSKGEVFEAHNRIHTKYKHGLNSIPGYPCIIIEGLKREYKFHRYNY